MKRFIPYWASFWVGIRLTMGNHSDLLSAVIVYCTLLAVFHAIFAAFPMAELGNHGITAAHLLWYLAVTEIVVVSSQGNERELGGLIAEGQITSLMQRPRSMMGLLLARLMGNIIVCAGIFACIALVAVPAVTHTVPPIAIDRLPLFFVSVAMGTMIFILFGYTVSTIEILGPYSRPIGWIVNKMIMALGGLFFPVIFFPQILQKILAFTPFPAVISVPGNFMLLQDDAVIRHGLMQQIFWLIIMLFIAMTAQRRMIRHVMIKGD